MIVLFVVKNFVFQVNLTIAISALTSIADFADKIMKKRT